MSSISIISATLIYFKTSRAATCKQAQIIVSFTRARSRAHKRARIKHELKAKKDACVGGEEKEREEPAGGKRVAGLGQTKDARNNFIQTLPIILAVPIHSIMYSRIWSLSLKQIDIQSGCLAHHCKLLISPSAW